MNELADLIFDDTDEINLNESLDVINVTNYESDDWPDDWLDDYISDLDNDHELDIPQ